LAGRSTDGSIARKQGQPNAGLLITAHVASVDKTLKKINAAGGSIVVPKRAIPDIGWQTHFRDPEGNVIWILENKLKEK
jgi:predicted enzyme related to lactoylglutathione lyase